MAPHIAAMPEIGDFIAQNGIQMCANVTRSQQTTRGPRQMKYFYDEITFMGDFIRGVCSWMAADMDAFHSACKDDIFAFSNIALRVSDLPCPSEYDKSKREEAVSFLAGYAANLCRTLPPPKCPVGDVHPAVLAMHDERASDFTSLEYGAFTVINGIRKYQLCFAMNCPESMQSSGKSYQRCGGCGVVSYCSKACQKRAWTDPEIPHRPICAVVGQVYKSCSGAIDSGDVFRSVLNIKKAGISDSDLILVTEGLAIATMMMQTTQRRSSLGGR